MSPIAQGQLGSSLETTPDHFPNVFDYWSLPRSTLSLYRLSAICQPNLSSSNRLFCRQHRATLHVQGLEHCRLASIRMCE